MSPHASLAAAAPARPRARGKFLVVNDKKLYIRGVTYGAFRPDTSGQEYTDTELIERDFAQMAAQGINAVRIPHTMPPRSLLDIARRHGLWVMVGLSAEQHVGYLIDRKNSPDIEALIRSKVGVCAGHPAVLCYAIGNEIPAPVARWLGHRRVERYIQRLYRAIKVEDPEALVTYVNYPSTEYLDLPFLDLVCFNVYLETQERLEAYVARLQNIAGDRPLVMSELGLDSMRNGEQRQAEVVDWQVRTAFAGGCAGAFVFSWTDEWFRAGADVEDWAFGVTDRDRRPKPALAALSRAFADVPFRGAVAQPPTCPRMSIVVCSYNGARTIRDTLDGVCQLDYPDYEIIVVDDGSVDATAAIAHSYPRVRVISTENRGLGSARNTGMTAATGEIVAYIDDDAYPDPHWLQYLAATFRQTRHAAVGGPNIAPPGDGPIADCVANAPGGPMHVLLTDGEAEHVPGCNLAIRKSCLEAVGGFDPQFRTAGDDVDVCWRLQQHGWTLGFSPAAVIWHHRRNSVRTYWKQQVGYGKAEALLERKWPEKYNALGHFAWTGRVYGKGLRHLFGGARRIYHGSRGSAPFQSAQWSSPGVGASLPLMPEWYLVVAGLAVLAALGTLWEPLLVSVPLLVGAVGLLVVQAASSTSRAAFTSSPGTSWARLRLHGLTFALHLLQPMARLRGRLQFGLTPWRARGLRGLAVPWPRAAAMWCEAWQEPQVRLSALERALRAAGAVVVVGGAYDRWDFQVRGGTLGKSRVLVAVEDHGAGTQFVRIRAWPICSPEAFALVCGLSGLSATAAGDDAWIASALLGMAGLSILLRWWYECAASLAVIIRAFNAAVVGDGLAQTPAPVAVDADEAPATLPQAAPALQQVRGSTAAD